MVRMGVLGMKHRTERLVITYYGHIIQVNSSARKSSNRWSHLTGEHSTQGRSCIKLWDPGRNDQVAAEHRDRKWQVLLDCTCDSHGLNVTLLGHITCR